MKRLIYILLLISLPFLSSAQKKAKVDTTVYTAVEIQPEFPGGEAKFAKFLMDHIHYPKTDEDAILASRTVIRFIIEKDGSLTNFEMLKGSKAIANQIIDHLKKGPKWIPGQLNGKIVRVKNMVPITICLSE